ncbi:Aldolase-type TIM barrel [Moorella glycerini]|uniref:FeMo cofactor biosynthesis protein NifB n=1 Tax=Neomoorella stamsii TaxID=1266720 RepID=A0A9X7J2R0_9FIRM|nr:MULTISPECIES: radical SAM protein [Moorella]PRR72393.1 FeMo cofactor biosynthesis protein NifB [Moorella stamsii]CEP67402.1 Aldolase-type TIM barrel [Moorella glycerini]
MGDPAYEEITREHPCYNKAAARWFGRIHLPVAPDCNIKCRYCTRLYDCANENRPGVTSHLMTPGEALQHVQRLVERDRCIRVVGVAGPGEPLANKATIYTLRLVHRRFPWLTKCISTNGLLLTESLPTLREAGVRAVTVTVNAVSPAVGSRIYDYVSYRGRVYKGAAGAELLWQAQSGGIRRARESGMVVKVNSVLIPGINDHHLEEVARAVKAAGAHVMNIIPLIPQGEFVGLLPPPPERVNLLRRKLSPIIDQMSHCRRCRADAAGRLG